MTSSAKFLKISRVQIPAREYESRHGERPDSRRRLLCANDDRFSVWQAESSSSEPLARIEGVVPAIAALDFGSDENEVVVFHAWNTKVTVFSLATGHRYIINAPKFTHSGGFGYRPRTGQFAILLKPETTDILTIHETHTYQLISCACLPTVDAKGVKWSPDGRWIAVWETPSAGTKVLVYTADGQYFTTYTGPASLDDDSAFDVGVRSIEWSPTIGGYEEPSRFLAVGKIDATVDILQTKTVRAICSCIQHYCIPCAKTVSSFRVPFRSHTRFNLASTVMRSGARGILQQMESLSMPRYRVTVRSERPPQISTRPSGVLLLLHSAPTACFLQLSTSSARVLFGSGQCRRVRV